MTDERKGTRWQYGECDRCGRPMTIAERVGDGSVCYFCLDEEEAERNEAKEEEERGEL